jgi:hypothetical protein
MSIKRIRLISSYAIIITMIFLAFTATAEAAPKTKNGAKTSPPPKEFYIMGIFNPNHLYLQDGVNKIAQGSSGQAKITATTYASQTVNSIGITFYLQKWNGYSWEYVDSGVDYSASNRDSYTNNVTYSVEKGYYYRARTIHWVVNGGQYEQGERYSDYLLIN